jgi:integrase
VPVLGPTEIVFDTAEQKTYIAASPALAAAFSALKPTTQRSYAAALLRVIRSGLPFPVRTRAAAQIVLSRLGPSIVSALNFLQEELGLPKMQQLVPHFSLQVRQLREQAAARRQQRPERRPLTFDSFSRIVRLGAREPRWVLHAIVVWFGMRFGLRASELAALQDQHVRWAPPYMTIKVKGKCDTNWITLKVTANDEETRLIQGFIAARTTTWAAAAQCPVLLTTPEGLPLEQNTAHAAVTKIVKEIAAHIHDPLTANYSSHSLRAGYATHALEAGANVERLKIFGRWKSEAYSRYVRYAIREAPW